MEQFIYTITNEELRQTIIDTNAMIKACDPSAERKPALEQHLKSLLDIQISRARAVVLKDL
jgi:hypothetical protein